MLIDRLKQKLSNQFIRNLGWLGGAELVNRILRLGAVIVLARLLSSHDYGMAAIVLTINEFASVFTLKSGIGSKLIQANEKDLPTLCETAYWMNWLLSIFLFMIQCIAAFPIAHFYKNDQIILPICVSAIVYLMLPTFAVQSALIYRENRLNIPALCNVLQAVVGNALTILLAVLGWGMWALVLPVVFVTPVWVVINRMNHPWRSSQSFTLFRWREIASFSLDVVGVELLNKIRANVDYLLVGGFLGINALGIYYFAFNAGLGISLNIINSFTWSLYPHLCDVRHDPSQLKKRYFDSLKTIAFIVIPFVTLQAGLAQFYVPVVYGQKWIVAIPVLVLICLSALPRPFAEAASMLLQAVDKTRVNLYWNVLFTGIFGVTLLCVVKLGIIWVALTVFLIHMVALPLFTVWANRFVFKETFLSFGSR